MDYLQILKNIQKNAEKTVDEITGEGKGWSRTIDAIVKDTHISTGEVRQVNKVDEKNR